MIEQSARQGRMALRLAGTSRKGAVALTEQYRKRYEAAADEAERASRSAAQALREGPQTLADDRRLSLLAPEGTVLPPGDVQATAEFLDALRKRLPAADRRFAQR
ncbi:hypothetical protein ACIRP0_23520 [Streptomyces sp. NPDC101733]|uniref:hypothetical protein n=1 Tax=unclassified Streptomyces TaxID=2593676 RepID=UPI00380FDDBD